MPQPETELNYRNNYELLVAVILSAQCTDKLVNKVTPALFEVYPTAGHLSKATFEEVNPLVNKVNYHNTKTRNLLGMARVITEDFGGKIPDNIDDLVKLPGVGRKTANVVASVAFNQNTMPVDTHVFRVSQRIGLVPPAKTPLEVEQKLIKLVPQKYLGKFHHWLILHGRYTCKARRPLCENCGLTRVCTYYQKVMRKEIN